LFNQGKTDEKPKELTINKQTNPVHQNEVEIYQ